MCAELCKVHNDTATDTAPLFALQKAYSCVEKVELLPFRKLCTSKYESLAIPFPLADTPEATKEQIETLLSQIQ